MEIHDQLLQRIADRKGAGQRFGQGFNSADRYAQGTLECVGPGICKRYFGQINVPMVVKEAAGKLVYCGDNLCVEKLATSESEIRKEIGGELPAHAMMLIKHVLTTPREDRDSDVLETAGAHVDPKMPLLWQHIHTLPIGKLFKVLEQNDQVLRMASVLLDLNELTSDAAKLVEADALRFSHGFRALKFTEMTKGFRVTDFEIMEESLVSVPSNIDAEVELYSRGKLKSDAFKMHAKAMRAMLPRKFAGIGKSFGDLKAAVDQGAISVESATELSKAMLAAPAEKHACGCEDKSNCACGAKADVNVSTGGDVFATEIDAEMRGSVLGCLGAHQLPNGTWMPCASPEVYQDYAGAVPSLPEPVAPHFTVSADPQSKSYERGATVKLNGQEGKITQVMPGPVYAVTPNGGNETKWHLESELTLVQGADNGANGEQNTTSAEVPAQKWNVEPLIAAFVKRYGVTPKQVSEMTLEQIAVMLQPVEIEKAGRVLSQRNQARLQDCHDTLQEMEGMDGLPRAAKSMCKDCRSTLKAVMDEATPEDKPDGETSVDAAVKQILGIADPVVLKRLHGAIEAIMQVQKSDKRVAEYRQLTKRTPATPNGSVGKR